MKNLLIALISGLLVLNLSACADSEGIPPSPLVNFAPSIDIDETWFANTGQGAHHSHLMLQPVIEGNTLYTVDQKGLVSAIDLDTSEALWRKQTAYPFSSNLAQNDAVLLAGTSSAQLVALDKESGNVLWTRKMSNIIVAAPTISGNVAYVKTIDGQLSAIDLLNHELLWGTQQNTPDMVLRDASNPVVQKGDIVVGFSNGTLSMLHTKDGSVAWSKRIATPSGKTEAERMIDISANPIVTRNMVYAGTYQGQIVALDRNSGELSWKKDFSIHRPMALHDNLLFLTDTAGNVVALNQYSGRVQWKQDALLHRGLTGVAIMDNRVIVGDQEGYIHILSSTDGHFLARIKVDPTGLSATPMVHHDMLYVFTNNGSLFGFKLNSL